MKLDKIYEEKVYAGSGSSTITEPEKSGLEDRK